MSAATQNSYPVDPEQQGFHPGFVTGVQELQRLWAIPNNGDTIEVISPPSEILGYATEEEKAVLDDPASAGLLVEYLTRETTLPSHSYYNYCSVRLEGRDFASYFPNLAALIGQDLAKIGASDQGLNESIIDQISFRKGLLGHQKDVDGASGWHFDNPSKIVRNGELKAVPELYYALATKLTTETYEGKALSGAIGLRVSNDTFNITTAPLRILPDETSRFDTFSEYALVRMSPTAFHRQPNPDEPTERTFLRVTIQPKQDWESFVLAQAA